MFHQQTSFPRLASACFLFRGFSTPFYRYCITLHQPQTRFARSPLYSFFSDLASRSALSVYSRNPPLCRSVKYVPGCATVLCKTCFLVSRPARRLVRSSLNGVSFSGLAVTMQKPTSCGPFPESFPLFLPTLPCISDLRGADDSTPFSAFSFRGSCDTTFHLLSPPHTETIWRRSPLNSLKPFEGRLPSAPAVAYEVILHESRFPGISSSLPPGLLKHCNSVFGQTCLLLRDGSVHC